MPFPIPVTFFKAGTTTTTTTTTTTLAVAKIVVIGNSGKIIYSNDLSTWNTATTPHSSDANYTYSSVTYSPARRQFVAAYSNGGSATAKFNTSNDGITWIDQVNPTTALTSWGALAWSPTLSLYVACSQESSSATASRFASSPDGVTWTLRSAPSFSGVYHPYSRMIWSVSSSAFIAIGQGPTTSQNSAYSTNGTSWTTNTASATLANAIAEGASSLGAGKHVKVYTKSTSSFICASATDVTSTWTSRTQAMTSVAASFLGVAWSPSLALYCAISSSAVMSITSTDGTTWSRSATGITALTNVSNMTWSASLAKFIAVGTGSSGTVAIMTSTNGTTWSTVTAPTGSWNDVIATS